MAGAKGGLGRATHLQRAYKIFEQMTPQYLTARELAALMCTWPATAYNYIQRLKKAKCIELKGSSGRAPLYGLVDGATTPANDSRGRPRREQLVVGTGQ